MAKLKFVPNHAYAVTLVINQWPLHLADIILINIGNTKNSSCFAMQKSRSQMDSYVDICKNLKEEKENKKEITVST